MGDNSIYTGFILSFSYIPSHVYTHISVLHILVHSLVVGVEICTVKQGELFQQECHYFNIKEHSLTSYRLYSGCIYMQGTHECVIWNVQTLQVNGEILQH